MDGVRFFLFVIINVSIDLVGIIAAYILWYEIWF